MIKILIVGASGKMGKAVYEESKEYEFTHKIIK